MALNWAMVGSCNGVLVIRCWRRIETTEIRTLALVAFAVLPFLGFSVLALFDERLEVDSAESSAARLAPTMIRVTESDLASLSEVLLFNENNLPGMMLLLVSENTNSKMGSVR